MADAAPTGAQLRAYLAGTAWAGPLAERHLRKRLARGKENPDRWREKLGEASLPRPDGPLVWMHAVGLGEVLALDRSRLDLVNTDSIRKTVREYRPTLIVNAAAYTAVDRAESAQAAIRQ